MTNIAQHTAPPHPNFRNRSGVMAAMLVGAAFWTCICIALIWALTSCAPPVVTLAPATITCTAPGQSDPIQTIAVDAVTLVNGTIETVTVGGQSAAFDAGGLTCTAVKGRP